MGYDLFSSFATAAACINNMGLGFGVTAVTFGTLNEEAKLLMCAAMIMGRLEIYPILILFSRMVSGGRNSLPGTLWRRVHQHLSDRATIGHFQRLAVKVEREMRPEGCP